MDRKLPSDAFEYYLSMGSARSYQKVADHYGVVKRTVNDRAVSEGWSKRLAAIEQRAREMFDERAADIRVEARERHLKILKAIEGRAVQALQKQEIDSGFAAVKALEVAIKLERVILGETTENLGVSMQEVTRREVETFLARADEPEDDPDDDGSEPPNPTAEG